MSTKIDLRKCTICHEPFGWNGYTRCICDECKKQSVPDVSCKKNDKDLYIVITHNKILKASA